MSATQPTQLPDFSNRTKITTIKLQEKKKREQPISMLTAYDYPSAMAVDAAGLDAILVGDSLGMVVLGYPNTLPVTMDDMLHHCKAVARGAMFAMLIGDMPFLSYHLSVEDAVRNAGRFLQEGLMDAVKLEGGRERVEVIRAIVSAGIPVMGHLGLTPQSIHQLGGFRAQGRKALEAGKLFEDSLYLQDAGCFSIVLESIPARLAEFITHKLDVPTIGIGAGVGCDGQVLVMHDLLGLFDRFTPRFARQYAQLSTAMQQAFISYKTDVEDRTFPSMEHTVEMPELEWQAFMEKYNR